MAIKIRIMREEDYLGVYLLWQACPGLGLNPRDDSREGILALLSRNPQTCFVAVDEREEQEEREKEKEGQEQEEREKEKGKQEVIIGSLLLGFDGRRAHIYHAAVHPAYQRRGVGKALVERMMEVARELNIPKISLVAFKRNAGGNVFWEEMGFSLREDLSYRDRVVAEE